MVFCYPEVILGLSLLWRRIWSIQLHPTCFTPSPTCLAIQWVRMSVDSCSESVWRGFRRAIVCAHASVPLWHPPVAVVPHVLLMSPMSIAALFEEPLIWDRSLSCIECLRNSIGEEWSLSSLRCLKTLFHNWELLFCSTGLMGQYVDKIKILWWWACSVVPVSRPIWVWSL